MSLRNSTECAHCFVVKSHVRRARVLPGCNPGVVVGDLMRDRRISLLCPPGANRGDEKKKQRGKQRHRCNPPYSVPGGTQLRRVSASLGGHGTNLRQGSAVAVSKT